MGPFWFWEYTFPSRLFEWSFGQGTIFKEVIRFWNPFYQNALRMSVPSSTPGMGPKSQFVTGDTTFLDVQHFDVRFGSLVFEEVVLVQESCELFVNGEKSPTSGSTHNAKSSQPGHFQVYLIFGVRLG
jgi:hypothetical protein